MDIALNDVLLLCVRLRVCSLWVAAKSMREYASASG